MLLVPFPVESLPFGLHDPDIVKKPPNIAAEGAG